MEQIDFMRVEVELQEERMQLRQDLGLEEMEEEVMEDGVIMEEMELMV